MFLQAIEIILSSVVKKVEMGVVCLLSAGEEHICTYMSFLRRARNKRNSSWYYNG